MIYKMSELKVIKQVSNIDRGVPDLVLAKVEAEYFYIVASVTHTRDGMTFVAHGDVQCREARKADALEFFSEYAKDIGGYLKNNGRRRA